MKKLISFIVVLICFGTLTMYGQDRTLTISGVVMDAQFNEPLPGAQVFIQTAPMHAVMTDLQGRFTLSVASGEVVVFSFMGMTNYYVTVRADMPDQVIMMRDDAELLDELIVTGHITQRRIAVTAAITTVDLDQIRTPATSLNNMLAGRVAGVMTQLTSGEPGQNISNFWIRGIGTFGANAAALVLIDGLEGRLQDVDPDDVESFQILKDASATAVFGVRGANGVVIVTTRRGMAGPLQVTGRATLQINQLRRLPQYLESYDYARLANEARAMMGESDLFTPMELRIIRYGLDPDLFPNVNWIEEIIRNTSMQQRYYVSVRGGSQNARFFLSMGLQNEEAAYRQEDARFGRTTAFHRMHYRANIDMDLTRTTTLTFLTEGHIQSLTLPGNQSTQVLWDAVRNITPLMMPVRYSDGSLPTFGVMDMISPRARLNYMGYNMSGDQHARLSLVLRQVVDHGPLRGLDMRLQLMSNIRTFHNQSRTMNPPFYRATGRDEHGNLIMTRRISPETVRFTQGSHFTRTYFGQAQAEWNRSFGRHDVGLFALGFMEEFLDGGRGVDPLGINNIPERRQNLSGRFNYGFDNTYFLDLNFGLSGSSQFRRGQRYGFFPSVSFGWIPTSYQWMEDNIPTISFLRLRVSHGQSGNDRIQGAERFPFLTLINNAASTHWPALSIPGITETRIGADNLRWEVATMSNFGIDMYLFNSALRINWNAFYNQRDDIFQQRVTLPQFAGLTNLPFTNVGRMRSWGSDGNVTFRHVVNRDVDLTIRANYTLSRNLVLAYEEPMRPYEFLMVAGRPHGIIRGFIAEGLFTCYEDIRNHADQSGFGIVRPGDIKFRDVTGNGVINADDRVPLSYGNQLPRVQGGLGGDVRWRNLTVGVLFRGSAGVDFFRSGHGGNAAGWMPFWNEEQGNVLKIAGNPANRWIPEWFSGDPATENPNAIFPRLSYGGNTNNEQLSTFWQRDGSFIRMQEISIRYRLRGHDWIRTLGLSSLDLEFVTNNVFTLDRVGLWDPEQASANGAAYPIPRSFTFQVFFNF